LEPRHVFLQRTTLRRCAAALLGERLPQRGDAGLQRLALGEAGLRARVLLLDVGQHQAVRLPEAGVHGAEPAYFVARGRGRLLRAGGVGAWHGA